MSTMENDGGDDSTLWSATNEKIYIDVMVDLINKGGMKDGQFSSKEWTNMLEALNNKSKRNYNMKQIKQKFNRLRSKHREFSELLQQTGFGWDAETNTVNATDEMWQNYIRVHPKATQFRKKGCEHYKLLGIIFNKSTATGVFRHASTSDPPNTDDEMELEAESAHVNISRDDPFSTLDKLTSNVRKRTASSSSERRSKKETRSQQMSDAIQAWTETAKAKTEVAKAKAEKYKSFYSVDDNSIGNAKDCSIATCVSLLEAIDGVDNATYLKAVEKLREADWREIFIHMSSPRKKAWLDSL
ncbi:L10-interacting MYB domain-containing protein-like [Ziziphus jujuba]|uniref:L10-interacting MYB domain-containing protein-like n=1 Tax=Ziziphus jujuba TaxID=326968 RepID=A0A6P4A1Z5_ZIZJJ|nr:L10-interacting MYB domain-containing protein-like [Ziziphus jujuba]XP_060676113.1 L10-interacting MYB domain-containing protein-like [Ziziphus jujuba]